MLYVSPDQLGGNNYGITQCSGKNYGIINEKNHN